MNVLKYFSWFKDLKGFFKYLQWLKNSRREGKQNGPQRFLDVTNEFVLLKVSVEVLTVFRMNSSPTVADGSCTIGSHKRWIESFWKPLSVDSWILSWQSPEKSSSQKSWHFLIGEVSKGTEMLWGCHGYLLGMSSLLGSGWQNHL